MDEEACALAGGLVSPSYLAQGRASLTTRRKRVRSLLSSRRLPEEGWDEATIEMLVRARAR
jgi:O-phospho-L-seryl-tRNASec:L-selenocysteinyl-tRNA synthase